MGYCMDKNTVDAITAIVTGLVMIVIFMSLSESWPWQKKK